MNSQSGNSTETPGISPEKYAADWTVGDPVVLPKAALRQIATYGHVVERFALAQQLFLKRAAKPGVFDEIKPWLEGLSAAAALPAEGDGIFASTLLWENGRLFSHGMLLDEFSTNCMLELWKKLAANAGPPPPLTGSSLANASLWPALLRLNPLREFWERELGRSHMETLCAILPDAWIVARGGLPPGAVIPRLEISSWAEFAQIISPETSYHLTEVHERSGGGTLATQEAIDGATADSSALKVLTEVRSVSGPVVAALYERKGRRTEPLGRFAFRESVSVHALTSG